MQKTICAVVALGILGSASAAQAQDSSAPQFSLTTGLNYSSGDYGTGVDTDILVVPASARLKLGNLRFTATIPYIRINGANVVAGDGGPIIVDPNAPRIKRDGIGDLTMGVNYAFPEEQLGFGLDLGARVKAPTADSGLGTGEVDYRMSAELSKTVGAVTPFVAAGYRILGDPAGVDLQNGFYSSAGVSVAAGSSVFLASYDYRESASALASDSHEVFGAFSTPVSDALNLALYGSAGLSDGAPDFGVGAMVTIKAF